MENPMDGMTVVEQPKLTNELDLKDLCNVRLVIMSIVTALNEGPKSRERSLVITKLEEASMWANEGLRRE
jgi:hypothetical protein